MKPYAKGKEEVLDWLGSQASGLSAAQAGEGLRLNGPNRLEQGKRKSLGRRVFEQVKDPMILVLIGAGVISGVFGELADMAIILVVVALNAVLGIVQESKAEKAIEALQRLSAPHAKVRRDGAVQTIDTSNIVLGDIVLLEAGDAVPADLRLLEAASLKVDEAALTGESVPVEKTVETLDIEGDAGIPLGDRHNMAYMGTSVTYGRGEGVVSATGMRTEMGKIAGILASTIEEKTPLQRKLAGLSKALSVIVLGVCAFIFLFTILREGGFAGGHLFEAFLTAVSLAVAAIPEGLVVVVTVLLSIGVTRMSSRRAIIRRLTAVETLGCTQVICSDKTGTLTQNKMTVVDHFGDEAALATAMALCNDASFDAQGNLVGDPTETALVAYAKSLGIGGLSELYPRGGEAPFDSNRKLMSTLNKTRGGITQYTKGAPDEIIARCNSILIEGKLLPFSEDMRAQALAQNKRMADKALRVLGAARKEYTAMPGDTSPGALERDMTFLGLCGMIDPVRPEVQSAIEECKRAGIRAIMITGDHRDTAMAIARELGVLTHESQAITGAELNVMSDAEFEERISDIVVYARVQPEHKVRIVNTWKKRGKVTAMTGDGVNDAPALKAADIGVGMGITGTDVTKNVADMVLADDNFATIVCAVEEGRRIYENIRKAVQFLLASNLAEVLAIFFATIAGWRLLAPIHILWINLVTDTFPAMALGMESAEADAMMQPPRPRDATIFSGGLGANVVFEGIVVAALTLAAFICGNAVSHITGMTMAFTTLSFCEIFHSYNMRSRDKSIFSIKGGNKFLLGATALALLLTLGVIYIPGLNNLFELTAQSAESLITAIGIAIVIIPAVEIRKCVKRLRMKRAG